MGYYVNFVFNGNKISSQKDVVDLFCKAGASIFVRPDEDVRNKDNRFIDLQYPKFSYFINVFSKETASLKGSWAYIRMSWATKPDTFISIMMGVFELADAVGARVYDGQIGKYVSWKTIDEVAESFFGGAKSIVGALGEVDIKKYTQQMKKYKHDSDKL